MTASPHTRRHAYRADTPPGAVGGVVVGGDYQGLGIARSLGRHGVPVIVIDDERCITTASRYSRGALRVPRLRDEAATLDALESARLRFGLDGWVVYPTRDETVAVLAANRERLEPYFRIPTPGSACIRSAWDKRETYALAERLGVPIPRTWFPRAVDDLRAIDLRAPVVVKPAIKEHFFYATHAKAWRADTRDELAACFRRATDIVGDGEVIVQELVPGGGEQQFSYCCLFKGGQPVAAMTVRRWRQHPSDFGRASTFVETVSEPALVAPSVRFLEAIDYYGLVELEYKRDSRDGEFKLLDVNARTWGYHSVAAAAGIDFPYLLYLDQVSEPVPALQARAGVRWIRLATDLPNAVKDVRAGTQGVLDYLRSLRTVDTEAVFAARDPLPFLYELALLPYLAVVRGL